MERDLGFSPGFAGSRAEALKIETPTKWYSSLERIINPGSGS
jgi:hypothetical protein